jgi:hypothetical protein
MARTKAQRAEAEEAAERLRGWLKPGDTVYCILRHCSRSGMQRVISLKQFTTDPERGISDGDLSWNAARALGMRYDRQREGIVIGGVGMDMGFALVYDLAFTLWPNGFGCIGEGCPSNDHSNGDRNYQPHGSKVGCSAGSDSTNCHCTRAVHWHGACAGTEAPCRADHWHREPGYSLRHRWL